jgi:hypothetical protein
MSLAPKIDVTLGSLRYDAHVSALRVTLALLPAVNSFSLSLPADVKFSAAPGDDAILLVTGGDDAGDGQQTIITGKLRSARRSLREIRVTGADAGADLSALRPATTYQQQSAAEVIKALTGDVGVDPGNVEADLDLAAYAAHQSRTAAEHIAYLATLAGCIAHVNGDGQLDVIPVPGEQAEKALLYGRELVDFEATDAPAPAAQRFAIGSGTAGATGSPEALKHSMVRLPDDAAMPGAAAVWYPTPVLRTPKTARAAGEALNDRASALTRQMRARCFLLPGMRPGMVVEIQELPGNLSGNTWLLTRVTHRLRPNYGSETILDGVLAGASGGSLIGALADAIGSLV